MSKKNQDLLDAGMKIGVVGYLGFIVALLTSADIKPVIDSLPFTLFITFLFGLIMIFFGFVLAGVILACFFGAQL